MPTPGGTEGNEPGNPHLDVQEVLALWRDSAPGELRKKWYTIDPAEQDDVPAPAAIALRKQRIQRVLGMLPADEEIVDILERLGMRIQSSGADGWQVLPPSYRFDIALEADLIEEIARIVGYHNIPSHRPRLALDVIPRPEAAVSLGRLREALIQRGYQEAVTYSFVDKDADKAICGSESELVLSNPISSEMSVRSAKKPPSLIRSAGSSVKSNSASTQPPSGSFAGSWRCGRTSLRLSTTSVICGPNRASI